MEVKTVKYKELLTQCKQNPCWLASSEQKDKIAQAKYMEWMDKIDKEHIKKATQNKDRKI